MPSRRPVNPLAQETASGLHSAAIHLLRRVRLRDKESGVPPAQLSALSVLVFGGPRRLGELAAIEHVAAPTMSRIVAGLEQAKLVRRTPDPQDRRAETIAASDLGEKVMYKAQGRRLEALTRFLGHASAGDIRALQRAIALVREFLAEGGT